jgi:hypothetical protein
MKKLNKKGLESNHCFVQVSYGRVVSFAELFSTFYNLDNE